MNKGFAAFTVGMMTAGGFVWAELLSGPASAQSDSPRFTGAGLVPQTGDAPAWDDTSTDLYFANNRVRDAATETYAWSPSLTGRVINGHNGDVLVVTVKKGRRTEGTHRCQIQNQCDQRTILTEGRSPRCEQTGSFAGLTPYAEVNNCRMDDIAVQSAGDFDFELSYEDANTGETTLIRTLKVPVIGYAHMTNRQERRHATMYVPMPKDMVGSSWMEYTMSSFGHTTAALDGQEGRYRQFEYFTASPTIHFWALSGNSSSAPGDAALRCKVDGTPVRINQSGVNLRRDDGQQGEDWRTRDGNEVTREKWGYNHYEIRVPWRVLVKENDREVSNEEGQRWSQRGIRPGSTDRHFDLSDQPGAYECKLVLNGTEVRTFRFTVNDHGIAPHAEQTGDGGIQTTFGRLFIETEIPRGTDLDQVFDQRAARATGFFGRSWGADVADMVRAFPASTRTQGPPAVPGARRRR